jgi:ADP-ribose pyrophosphatase YjhB (NUDIX family)
MEEMPKLTKRFKLVPGSHVFLVRDQRILLLRRSGTGYEDGNFGVIAGHFNGGETARDAAVREAAEEVGLSLNADDLELVHIMHRQNVSQLQEEALFFFVARDWKGEPHNAEPDKCDEMQWFPISRLPSNMIPHVRSAIAAALVYNQVYSEFAWDD